MNPMTGSKKKNIGLIANKCGRLVKYLEAKNNILLLTTSTLRLSVELSLASLRWRVARSAVFLCFFYLGYDPTAGPVSVIVGTLYSLMAGAVAGGLFGWLYNSFVESC